MPVRIYHNPRCSTSRKTLALLRDKGVEPEIVEYLNTPYTAAQLKTLLGQLKMPARAPFAGETPAVRRRPPYPGLSALQGGEGFWLLRGLGLRRLGRGAQFLHDLPVRVAGETVLVEEQHRPVRDEEVGRVLDRLGFVVQHPGRLVNIIARIQRAVAHLQLARQDVDMRAGEVLVRRRGIALLPVVQRGPGAGLAADPQDLELVLRRPLDPGRVRAHQRVLDVLKHRANVLRQRHVRSSFCMRIAAQARVRASIKAKVRSISFIWIISASSPPKPGFDNRKLGRVANPIWAVMRADWSVSLPLPPRQQPMLLARA